MGAPLRARARSDGRDARAKFSLRGAAIRPLRADDRRHVLRGHRVAARDGHAAVRLAPRERDRIEPTPAPARDPPEPRSTVGARSRPTTSPARASRTSSRPGSPLPAVAPNDLRPLALGPHRSGPTTRPRTLDPPRSGPRPRPLALEPPRSGAATSSARARPGAVGSHDLDRSRPSAGRSAPDRRRPRARCRPAASSRPRARVDREQAGKGSPASERRPPEARTEGSRAGARPSREGVGYPDAWGSTLRRRGVHAPISQRFGPRRCILHRSARDQALGPAGSPVTGSTSVTTPVRACSAPMLAFCLRIGPRSRSRAASCGASSSR